jgi:predicted secreted acid phosphatase
MIAPPTTTTEPPAPAAPAAIVAYHDSGAWARDTGAVAERARRFLLAHRRDDRRRAALVLDVDDTALSTYACLERAGFDRAAGNCAESAGLPAVGATLELYRQARARGVIVFFVTRRREHLRAVTVAGLRHAGYRGHLRVRLAPEGGTAAAHRRFKAGARRRIEASGYRIVVNLGDQRSDLTGGYARRSYKLPNPMYLTR